VIDMDILSVIRRWALRDKLPIREISRRTGLSRNTIRRYLRAGIVEPKFKAPSRPSKLDPYAEKLSGWLLAEQRKSRKERRTAKQMHADLVQLGFDGSYERVSAFVRAWRSDRVRAQNTTDRGTFVPLVFKPGEAFQFDWSEDYAIIGGERTKLQVAHIKLSHSRAFLVRAYFLQTHEMLFDAHWHAFRVFEGVPGRGIYDNMRTAVDRVRVGKKRDVNARFMAMTSHYVFEPDFCNPAAGWEKGQVEKNVRDARSRMWQVMPTFPDLDALNCWLEERCKVLWAETSLHIYPERLVIVAEGHVVCEHQRIIERSHRQPGRVIYDWHHYLAVVQRKPGALRNGAPFVEMPEAFRQLQDKLLRKPGGDREMVEILSLVLHHDEQVVLCAVDMALQAGVPTKTHVLNLLHRLVDGTPTDQPDVTPPSSLVLTKEPEANVARYDGLRTSGGKRHAS